MANLPAHSRNYFTRANIPFGANNTSQIRLESYYVWALQAVLRDILTTGSTGGTRHPNSIWICRGSSNAVAGSAVSAVGVAGTDRWGGGTFPGNFTRGNNTVNHHWMLLENVTLGYEMLLGMSTNDGYLCCGIAKSGTYTGGTVSANPTPSPTTSTILLSQASYNTSDGGQYNLFSDMNFFGNTNYLHMTFADSGEFLVAMSRAGLNCFYNFFAVWKSVGQQVSDTNNMFVLACDATATGRGSPTSGRLGTSAFCASVTPNNLQKSGGGLVTYQSNGTNLVAGLGVDSIDAQYNAIPCSVIETTPQHVKRGTLPDLYQVGDGPVGGSIPTGAAQIRTVMGSMIVPFIGVIPLI